MTKTTESKLEHVESVVNSLKEITTIIVGLALTNTIIQFLSVGELSAVSVESPVIFVLLLINMIRFYHGNYRHLDVTYCCGAVEDSSDDIKYHPREKSVPIDFFFILTESLMLSAISFWQVKFTYFFLGFVALLAVDVIWGCVTFVTSHIALSGEVLAHTRNWAVNNSLAILLLSITLFISDRFSHSSWPYIFSAILVANTVLDYGINWRLYFPTSSEQEAKVQ